MTPGAGTPDAQRDAERLAKQLAFIVEIDKLKQVFRQTPLIDRSRRENDAEHSWQMAVMALLLAEYSDAPVDVLRVVKMLLIHDIVEIDAGDTFLYDIEAAKDQQQRERRAADRIFGLLPPDQAAELRALWDEFEAGQSADAKFARAIDRFQPLLHNYHTEGGTWKRFGIAADDVRARKTVIRDASSALWECTQRILEDSVTKGYLASSRREGAAVAADGGSR